MGALENEQNNSAVEERGEISQPEARIEEQVIQKRPGYDPVDLNGVQDEELRNKIQDRINYYHRQVSDNKKELHLTKKELNHFKTLATQEIEKLAGNLNQVTSVVQQQAITDAEAQIKNQMKVAYESGDTQGYIDAQDRLLELKAKKISQNQTQQRLQQKTEEAQQPASSDAYFDTDEQTIISSWQSETDNSGRPLREWAYENSPYFEQAQLEAKAVLFGERYKNLSIEQKLSEIDRRMGLSKSPNSQANQQRQAVMGGGLTQPSKINTITLTPRQEQLAIKTKFGGLSAKTDAEHIEAYRKSLEKLSKTSNQKRRPQ